jgi:hypothetical protein
MNRADAILQAVYDACHWRDVLWESIVADLARRNPAAAEAVAETLARRPVPIYPGRSTQYALWAWSDLDTQARRDWLWACKYFHREWMSDAVALLTNSPTEMITGTELVDHMQQFRHLLWKPRQQGSRSPVARHQEPRRVALRCVDSSTPHFSDDVRISGQ